MDKNATMTPEQLEAWESMAKDRTLRDWVSDGQYTKAMQRRMERLRAKRNGTAV